MEKPKKHRKKIARESNSVHSLEKSSEDMASFVLEFRALKYLPRACSPYLKNVISENVAEHSFYTTIIGWVLSELEGANTGKVIKMCLIHDLAEVRGGEKNLVNKFYTTPNDEMKILEEISKDYNLKNFSLSNLSREFSQNKTLEAKIAKDADVISQMLLEKECLDLGNFKAKRWLSTSLKRLETKKGKELGESLYDLDSDKWWLRIIKKHILKTKFLSGDEPFFHTL